ncbi:hypothetical protein [Actinomadura rudentiformis]|nr:hypothetical protein [Actinomadura rudentiformis]
MAKLVHELGRLGTTGNAVAPEFASTVMTDTSIRMSGWAGSPSQRTSRQ